MKTALMFMFWAFVLHLVTPNFAGIFLIGDLF